MLWNNTNPSELFPAQNIPLSTDDFEMYQILYFIIILINLHPTSQSSFRGKETSIFLIDSDFAVCRQDVNYISNNELKFATAAYQGFNNKDYNYCCVPMYVIGYKNILNLG